MKFSFLALAAAVPAAAKRGLRKAPAAELQNFERLMQRNLNVESSTKYDNNPNCLDEDNNRGKLGDFDMGFKLSIGGVEGCHDVTNVALTDTDYFVEEKGSGDSPCYSVLSKITVTVECKECSGTGADRECKIADILFSNPDEIEIAIGKKGSNGGTLYDVLPSGATGLSPGINEKNGNLIAISHIDLCLACPEIVDTIAPTKSPDTPPPTKSPDTPAPTTSPDTPAPTKSPDTPPDGPQVEGDPHIKAWSGKWFDYMGECDLVMLKAKAFDGHQDLQINIRTKIAYDYSYIEAAAIKIGEDVLEVGEYGDFAVNGVDTPYLGGKAGHIGGYELVHTQVSKKKHTYDIILNSQENITLASYKQLVSVKLHVGVHSEQYFASSEGILGSYSGDFLARDHKTIMEDTDAFGAEWQVQPDEELLFRAAREPQAPNKCVMPDVTSMQRRLSEHSLSEEQAKAACSQKEGAAFRNCVYDVMAIGDLDLAEAGSF